MLTRRDFLKLGAVGAAGAAAAFLTTPAAAAGPPPLIWRGSARHRYVALTYDDCYLVERLKALEALLDEYPDFKITLFPVGMALINNQNKNPGVWNRFYEKGHDIGYHSYDHTNFGVMSDETALVDYSRWLETLSEVMGFTPRVRFGRPTYGSLAASFDTVCREHGLVNTMWSTGWGGEMEVGLKAARSSRNGDIVLLHIRTQDLNTSVEAYKWMKTNDWRTVTLTRLYDDLLREQNESDGCGAPGGGRLARTCLE